MNYRLASFPRLSLLAVLLAGLALPPHSPAYAAATTGSGDINDTVTIYTIIGVVSGAATGNLSNAATIAVPVGTSDPTPAACVSGQFASWTFTGNNTNAATGAGLFTYDTVGLNTPTWPASQVGADTPAISFTGARNASYTANSDYVDFAVPTNGRGAITMSFIDYRSGTGPDSFVIYYSTDGTTYNALPPGTVYAIADTAWTTHSIDFSSITALNNISTAHFRLYPYRAAAGGSGLGTLRLDNVSFSGNCLADVAVTKTLDTSGPYSMGQSLTYTLTVTNNGPSTAAGISVTDAPTNLTITNVTSLAMTCTGNAFPCTLASLANGASATITVTARIDAVGAFDNSATVTSTSPDPDAANDTDNTGNGDTALPVINAVDDDYSGTPINGGVGGNAGNAFANDTLNGAAVLPAQITATIITPASDPGVTLDLATGNVDAAAGTPTDTYTIPYQICENINPTNCDTATITVLVNPPANISGVVFHDADLNGSKAGSEAGLVGVTVNLYDSTGATLIATTTTGAGGSYSFPNLTPGSYIVVEIDPAGYVSSTANTVPVTIAVGGSGTVNFGDFQLPNTALSSISGIVYEDGNANGVQDAGEPPLSGVTVELKDNLGTVTGTVVTGATGTYTFPNLSAGSYTVTETDLAGYTSTTLNNVAVNLSAGTSVRLNYGDQSGAALIADPAVTKFGTPMSAVVGDTVVYTITVGNNGNTDATNVVLTDTKPAFLDIVAITVSPNPGLSPVISGNTFAINFGTVTPTDFYTITVLTRVNSLGVPPGGANTVQLLSASGTDRLFNNASAAGLTIAATNTNTPSSSSAIPATGFAPNVITEIQPQPQELKYAATDIVLEIPSLGIKLAVVGVPKKNGAWDVAWLGNQAGWLEGTAFPSWNGNSVLTSHVYLSNGLPGPFVNLGRLKYGEMVLVHAYGQKYTFEVRTNAVVEPNDTSMFKHEEVSWLTLVTCKEYDEKTNTYKKRVVIRAVLVKVEEE